MFSWNAGRLLETGKVRPSRFLWVVGHYLRHSLPSCRCFTYGLSNETLDDVPGVSRGPPRIRWCALRAYVKYYSAICVECFLERKSFAFSRMQYSTTLYQASPPVPHQSYQQQRFPPASPRCPDSVLSLPGFSVSLNTLPSSLISFYHFASPSAGF